MGVQQKQYWRRLLVILTVEKMIDLSSHPSFWAFIRLLTRRMITQNSVLAMMAQHDPKNHERMRLPFWSVSVEEAITNDKRFDVAQNQDARSTLRDQQAGKKK